MSPQFFATLLLFCAGCASGGAAPLPASEPTIEHALRQDDRWFGSSEGKRVAHNIVTWQNANGGWWKRYDPSIPRPATLPPPDTHDAPPGDTEDVWRRTSTFDNGATYTEMRILARAYRITHDEEFRKAFERGLEFTLGAQYPNGGWPQRFPLENNYGRRITFNDNAMTNVMRLLMDVRDQREDFTFVSPEMRQRCAAAFDRGLDCILNCQIKARGKLTAWAQQHDEQTLAPAGGRAFELPGICAGESSEIVLLLMDLPKPGDRVRSAIDSAAAWFESLKITGKRVKTVEGAQYEHGRDRVVVDDPDAPPMWARFYDVETNRPFFCDRDGVKRDSIADLSWERRNHYQWYGTWGERVASAYQKWRGKRTIQSQIDAVPENDRSPHVIVIEPGVYKERIVVPANKPFITLRGQSSDASKTVLSNDWNASFVPPGTTQPVGTSGSASTTIEASDFVAENITFENSAGDKGQAVAVKATGDRAVFRNCRFIGWQDTLCADGGRQYYDHCYIEGRVDFIFGGATAVFDHCTIHSKNGGYVTAARTPPDQPFGYVFLDCVLTGEGAPAYLGRPWQWDRGRKANVYVIRTKMGPHIRAEGWNRWDRPNNPNTKPEENTRYFEFGSMDADGKPLDVSQRVAWSHQLTPEQAGEITAAKVLAGKDNWSPAK